MLNKWNQLEKKHKIMLIIVGVCLMNILICGGIFIHYHNVEQKRQELMLNMELMQEHQEHEGPVETIPPPTKPEIQEDDIVTEVVG